MVTTIYVIERISQGYRFENSGNRRMSWQENEWLVCSEMRPRQGFSIFKRKITVFPSNNFKEWRCELIYIQRSYKISRRFKPWLHSKDIIASTSRGLCNISIRKGIVILSTCKNALFHKGYGIEKSVISLKQNCGNQHEWVLHLIFVIIVDIKFYASQLGKTDNCNFLTSKIM